jgi:hypothetical protein
LRLFIRFATVRGQFHLSFRRSTKFSLCQVVGTGTCGCLLRGVALFVGLFVSKAVRRTVGCEPPVYFCAFFSSFCRMPVLPYPARCMSRRVNELIHFLPNHHSALEVFSPRSQPGKLRDPLKSARVSGRIETLCEPQEDWMSSGCGSRVAARATSCKQKHNSAIETTLQHEGDAITEGDSSGTQSSRLCHSQSRSALPLTVTILVCRFRRHFPVELNIVLHYVRVFWEAVVMEGC